jgi:ATP/maltotriose-dependent transcriptional regulator MalT
MKFQLVNALARITLLGAMLVVPAVLSVHAQSLQYRITANIPFEFSIGDKQLPAGKYSFGRARQASDDTVLSVNDSDGRWKAVRASSPVQTLRTTKRPKLVFHRYGSEYFLSQVWAAGAETGRQFPKTQREREVERKVAASSANGQITQRIEVETVTIVGLEQ